MPRIRERLANWIGGEKRALTYNNAREIVHGNYALGFVDGERNIVTELDTFATVRVPARVAMSVPAFAAGVSLIAGTFASLPVHVTSGDVTIEKHPLADMLNGQANAQMDGSRVRELFMQSRLIRGGGYMTWNSNGLGEAAELVVLPRDWCKVKMEGLEYTDPDTGVKIIPNGEFVAMQGLPDPDGGDLLNPLDPLYQFSEVFKLEAAAVLYGLDYFTKGGLPQVILLTEESDSDTQIQRATETIQKTITGGSRVATTSGVKSVVTVQADPTNAQYLPLRDHQIVEIARILNIQPALLQDLSRGTYSNVEQQFDAFWTQTMRPLIKQFNRALRSTDLLAEDEELVFDHSELTRGSDADRAELYVKALAGSAWMKPSEVREREGLEEDPDMDQRVEDAAAAANQPNDEPGDNNDG